MNIGLGSNAGIYSENGGPFFVMRDFFGSLTPSVAQTAMGLRLQRHGADGGDHVRGTVRHGGPGQEGDPAAVLLGMLVASVIYWAGQALFLGVDHFASLATASFVPPFADMMETTFFKFNFQGFLDIGWFTAITLVITFCMIDMFDTFGRCGNWPSRAGMVDRSGTCPT